MAVDTTDRAGIGGRTGHLLMYEIAVARQAVILKDLAVLRLDHDRLMKILKGEALRVVITVFRLGDVLADEVVREMAVHAFRHGVMARFLP